ncbi:hypothetical protein CRG98_032153 [Punica granatum]|uniref:Uncharacterized protein n=1 Tax=Punica granatum TaxID=22663 RepID=A0A2I0ITX4_PUNGR|nr:hypothetical protein CRG98_032153 [Punica granatum]
MALSFIWNLQNFWPFSRRKLDGLKVSDDLVRKLPIPDHTKQFVFAIREPESQSVVYILSAQSLSERSASDAECLIKSLRPDAVVAQVGHVGANEVEAEEHGFDDQVYDPVPTSAFAVLKRCFVDKVNKEKYESAAGNFVLREIFGISFHGNFFAAKKAAEEVGSSFLMLQSPFVKYSMEDASSGEIDGGNSFGVEGLRIALNSTGRLPSIKIGSSGISEKVEFSELPFEDKAQVLFAQALRGQARKFKTTVAVVDASALAGLRKHWNTPVPKEVKDLVGQIVMSAEDDGESLSHKKQLLYSSPVVAVGAGATAAFGVSSLSKVVPASTYLKFMTFNFSAPLKIFFSQTHKVITLALGKSIGPSKLAAPGLASSVGKSSALKAVLSAEKIRAVTHGVIASAEKTSISAMRTSFYQIMRKRQARPIRALPWATFGCSFVTCAGLLVYGDGIECAAESLPSAPSIASLGRGIQSLHKASQAVRQTESGRIQKSIESLMYRLKKVKIQ